MKLFEWQSDLDTGVALVDEQHRQYARFTNAFLKASGQGRAPRAKMIEAFGFLKAYAREHLSMEESLMDEYGFEGAEAHKIQHARFRDWTVKAADRLQDLEEPDSDFLLKVNYMLVDWFQQHIRNVDRSLTSFLRRKAEESRDPALIRIIKGIIKGSGKGS